MKANCGEKGGTINKFEKMEGLGNIPFLECQWMLRAGETVSTRAYVDPLCGDLCYFFVLISRTVI